MRFIKIAVVAAFVATLALPLAAQRTSTTSMQNPTAPTWINASMQTLERELVAKYGDGQRERLNRGLRQVAAFWRPEDGDASTFEEFVRTNFAGGQKTLDETFKRFEFALESLDGHMLEINRDFRKQSDLDIGEILPLDEALAGYDPSAHVNEDFFANKVAFIALLNFPLSTLEERLTQGANWSRRQWAETRLAQRFSKRIPAEVNLAISKAAAEADAYIADYNVWMHHVVDEKGQRLFPAKMRLLSHWNLRDQIKADYAEGAAGLARQRSMQKVMERIVTQTIPAAVVNNPTVDWNPTTNEVRPSSTKDHEGDRTAPANVTNAPEPDRRYEILLNTYKASRLADPYSPTNPTLIGRRFNENREIPEERVRAMFESVLSSPMVPRVAKLIEKRLGRKLEPFDIWYNGFKPRGKYTEAQLDEITRKKYPTPEAFRADIPNILTKLGFSAEKAQWLASNVIVDPARGSGHAMGAARRDDKTHLRTRVGREGMDYKGYNIAVHELGHNIEQTFSLNAIDHTLLQGVPNTAFTEALAFVFQAKDLELLGLKSDDPQAKALTALNDFWATYEIAGVALVDMAVWHWMYDHPNATPAELKNATLQISKDIWNRYYAPVFKKKDVVLLGIYSHMIHSFLYLPDYPIGHLIAFQIEEQMEKAGAIGPEFERMTTVGAVVPDVWMTKATGKPVGAEALLAATAEALKRIR